MTNPILNTIIKRRWLYCCLLFFSACFQKSPPANTVINNNDSLLQEKNIAAAMDSIFYYKKLVKQGDLILRTGRDFTSETFRQLSAHDKTYSHCGIASIEHDSVFVYHAIGGEWNPDQKLRRDPFEFFCNPYENRGFGIFRYKLSAQQNNNLSNEVKNLYRQGVMFDMQFDLATDNRMYCSEFVYKAITRATHDAVAIPVSVAYNKKFITTDDLFLNPWCSEVKRVKFQTQ